MKVLVIGPSPSRSKGGMATVIQGIRDDKKMNEEFDIDIYDSFIDGNKVKRYLYTKKAFAKFKKVYEGYDIYHIHVASYGSTFRKAEYIKFLKEHNKNIILHIHGAAYMDFYGKLSDSKKKYVVDILNMCDMVIALSDEWKTRFENVFGITNCVSIPNGIDTDEFDRALVNNITFKNDFLFLGRVGKRKGAYDIVDAVSSIKDSYPDVKVYMAGDGEVNQLKALVENRGLSKNIEVVGWVDFAGKCELLKKVATIILPSYNEGLPMTILEGMAAGKAIISSTVGAIPEVVKDDNGILVEAGDISAIANAMIYMMNNSADIVSYGHANRNKIFEEFSMQKMHKEISNCYRGVSLR